MADASNEKDGRPVVAVVEMEDVEPVRGFASLGRDIFSPHFRLVTQQQLEGDASLFEAVQAICVAGSNGKLLSDEWLDRMKNLKVVSSVSAGYNHLPLDSLKRRDVR